MVLNKWAVLFIWTIGLDSSGEEFWAWQQGARGHSLQENQTLPVQEEQSCQQLWVVGKPQVKHLCPALLSLPDYGKHHRVGASSKQHVAILTSMLQCLSIQVKWTAAASFAHNNMKQLENNFEKSRAVS